jgi:hypothetical protein
VIYQWVRSDGTQTPTQTLALGGSDPDSRAIQDTWQLGETGTYTGWEAVRLAAPQQTTATSAVFTRTCYAPPRAQIDKVVVPTGSSSCDVEKISFSGTITVDRGPVQVAYRWVFSDGTATPVKTVAFPGFGRQTTGVQTDLARPPESAQSGWAAIELSKPVAATSNRAPFTCPTVPR